MALLETEGLSKSFGALAAVDRVDLRVEAGTLHAVIGPNGAGKTTLFNLISALLSPTSGRIRFDGRDITGLAPHQVPHLGISRSFQRTNIFPNLTVFDNVWVAAYARAGDRRGLAWRRAESLGPLNDQVMTALAEVGLQERAGHQARALSHGEQRELEVSIALAAEPKLLLLDEPTAGLSPEETRRMMDVVRALKGRYTILLVEHKMDVIMAVSDRISVMNFGRIIAEGSPEEVQGNEAVRRAYLGTGRLG